MKWKRIYSNCKLLSAFSEVNISSSPQPSTDTPDTGNHVGEEEMEDEDRSMYYIPVASTDTPDTGNRVGEEEMEDEDSSMYYIPVALGLLTLAALVLVMFSLLHRCVRHT